MRGKDIILICGALWGVITFFHGYYGLPDAVKAQAQEIEGVDNRVLKLDSAIIKINDKFEQVDLKQNYTNKSIDEIKEWLKSISSRVH